MRSLVLTLCGIVFWCGVMIAWQVGTAASDAVDRRRR